MTRERPAAWPRPPARLHTWPQRSRDDWRSTHSRRSSGGTTQWIRIRGADAYNPLLLLIQQGPGLPMINEARRFEQLFGLEQAFTVVYWDQRGCGRSLRQRQAGPISIEAMATTRCRSSISYGTDSAGSIRRRVLFRRDDRSARRRTTPGPGRHAGGGRNGHRRCRRRHQRLRLRARRRPPARQPARRPATRGHRPAPHLTAKQFGTRVRWATNFGGVTTSETYGTLARGLLASLVRSPDIGRRCHPDRPRHQRHAGRAAARAGEHGPGPHPAPPGCARRHGPGPPGPGGARRSGPAVRRSLQAPSKHLVWFDNSAHTPHLEEPGKFRDLLMGVREPRCTGRTPTAAATTAQP